MVATLILLFCVANCLTHFRRQCYKKNGQEQSQLVHVAKLEFGNLKNELRNKVADLAINFHTIYSDISSRYSSDAYVHFIPKITSLLNKFDAALKVSGDLKENLITRL